VTSEFKYPGYWHLVIESAVDLDQFQRHLVIDIIVKEKTKAPLSGTPHLFGALRIHSKRVSGRPTLLPANESSTVGPNFRRIKKHLLSKESGLLLRMNLPANNNGVKDLQ
jgi:hypothetical protein